MVFLLRFLVVVLVAASPAEPFKFGCTAPYACKAIKTCGQGHRDGYLENQVLFQCGHGFLCCPPPANYNGLAEAWVDQEEPVKQSYAAVPVVVLAKTPVPTTTQPPNHENLIKDREVVQQQQHRNRYLLPENNCGTTLNNKITGGQDSAVGEFPWMALIGFRGKGAENQTIYVCGGTLISDRYVLTAAHCIFKDDATLIQVRLGEFDLTKKNDCNGKECFQPAVDVAVEKVIQHKDWNNQTYRNDIALLRLNSSTQGLGLVTISPICLPLNGSALNLTDNYKFEAAGWGLTGWMEETLNDVLQKTHLAGISLENCNSAVCPPSMLRQSFCPVQSTQICVQGLRKRDVCKGDSGGPLMTANTLPTYQIGITSFKTTEVCGEELVPSVFTRIETFLPWILDHLEP